MIPEKNINESKNPEKEKVGTFDFFNIEHFLSKIIKNWYWFLILGFF